MDMRTPAVSRQFGRVMRAPAARARRWVVMVWLALLAGWISPLVHAEAMQLVCTSAGHIRWVDMDSDALSAGLQHGKECALCLALEAPPPAVARLLLPHAGAATPIPAWHQPQLPVMAASPFAARAPPRLG